MERQVMLLAVGCGTWYSTVRTSWLATGLNWLDCVDWIDLP